VDWLTFTSTALKYATVRGWYASSSKDHPGRGPTDAKLSPMGFVELDTTLDIASNVGLTSMHHIAVVDSKYDVYRLEPARPGPDAIVICDSREMCVTELISAKAQALTDSKKFQLASDAAAAIGIVAPQIYVVP
jgi:hypothetical protein